MPSSKPAWRPREPSVTSDLWYKRAVIYSLDVDTFRDSDGDGIGDFNGLITQLNYLAGLGVTCLWLLPFYPTPNRDNGYDVIDYYAVDPRLGTLGDFVEFLRAARERGMRVIIDLVVNHTSDQHLWFQSARTDPQSPYRDYYVWSQDEPEDIHEGMVFPGVQDAVWTHDEQAGAWYLHRFYKHQPDLNIANPAVREEIKRIMGFWLELGVSGFRVDAAPFLIEHRGVPESRIEVKDPYAYLDEFRDFLQWRRGDAVLLAEANVEMEEVPKYFGESGDRLHMLFNFYLNQQLFLALAQERMAPLARGWRAIPPLPAVGQWATFLRNHDEIDLGRLTEAERQEVFARFGPQAHMQLYGRGIRRRLAPMLGGDRRRLELAWSLMFSLPGTPVLWYGDEIGMGDDLSLDERNSIRTPMQWADKQNGGFSEAAPEQLLRPVISDGPYAYRQVNAASQERDLKSLLRWMTHLIRVRKECEELGRGACELLETGSERVFAHRCQWNERELLAVHNLSGEPASATLSIGSGTSLFDLLGDRGAHPVQNGEARVELEGYGYRWLRVERNRDAA